MQSTSNFGDNNRGVQIGAFVNSSDPHVKRQELIEWLAPINFLQKQNDVLSTSQPGTGQWFLTSQRFKDWQSGKIQILGCHSIPGAGKTVLTSIAVNYLQQLYMDDSKVGVACVYCEYKQQGLQTPANLLASIWRQLDQSKDESHPEVQVLYDRRGRNGTKPTIDEVVSVLRQEVWRHSVVYILIDALDECADDGLSREIFIAQIQELLATQAPDRTRIHILMTSRSPDSMLSGAVKMQIQAAEEDVKSFVSRRFVQGISRSGSISEDVRKDEKLKNWIIKTIVEKAEKIFLLARLHLDSLKYKTSLGDLREAVRHFPQGLDELYEETWVRVNSQNSDWTTLAYRTLGWLSSTLRQLKVEELRHALAVRSGDTCLNMERLPAMDVLRDSCHGLVAVDEESRIVRLVHRTAQEFFDRRRAQYFSDVHTQITRTCLDYLMFDVFAQGPCDFISSRPSDMRAAQGDISESRLLSTRFLQNPLLDYAASHWGHHARGEPEQNLEEPILRFLQPSATLDSFFQVQYSGIDYGGVQYADDCRLKTSGSLPLHVATSFGLEYITDILLGRLSASDINGLDRKGKTALHWAVLSESESLTLLLLQAGANIDTQVKAEYPDFQQYYSPGSNRSVESLLGSVRWEPREKIIVPNDEILENAVRFDMKKVIDMHVHSAVSAAENKIRANGVLWKASLLGNIDMLDFSLANGAEIEAKEKMNVTTPLDVHFDYIRVNSIPRRAKDQTALLMAVENGQLDATLALLSHGALISATDRFGRNALQTVVTSTKIFDERLFTITGTPGIIRSLRPSRSEPEFLAKLSRVIALRPMQSDGIGPERFRELLNELVDVLHEDDEQGDIIDRLLDFGADIAVRTQQSQSLLQLAISSATRLQRLLKRGASVLMINSYDKTGRTALHYAAAAGNFRAWQLLLSYGADILARDPMGATALHLGILSHKLVEAALQEGISANVADKLGRTPMHYLFMLRKRSEHEHTTFRTSRWNRIMGFEHVYENVVKLLEKAGARHSQDTKGLMPLEYIQAPFADQYELDGTAQWIDENEERYRLREEVVKCKVSIVLLLQDEVIQNEIKVLGERTGREPKWRVVPDEVQALPDELDGE